MVSAPKIRREPRAESRDMGNPQIKKNDLFFNFERIRQFDQKLEIENTVTSWSNDMVFLMN